MQTVWKTVVHRVYPGWCSREVYQGRASTVQGRVVYPGQYRARTPASRDRHQFWTRFWTRFGPASDPVLDEDLRRFMGIPSYSWSRTGGSRTGLFAGRNSTQEQPGPRQGSTRHLAVQNRQNPSRIYPVPRVRRCHKSWIPGRLQAGLAQQR